MELPCALRAQTVNSVSVSKKDFLWGMEPGEIVTIVVKVPLEIALSRQIELRKQIRSILQRKPGPASRELQSIREAPQAAAKSGNLMSAKCNTVEADVQLLASEVVISTPASTQLSTAVLEQVCEMMRDIRYTDDQDVDRGWLYQADLPFGRIISPT